jgi:hypothetical protein
VQKERILRSPGKIEPMDENNLDATGIINATGTAFSTVQKPEKVLACEGKSESAAERRLS